MRETEQKDILIYNDEGCGDSARQLMNMLENVVDTSSCRVLFVDSDYVNNKKGWEKEALLFVMPGGRARPYYTALGTEWISDNVSQGEMRIIAKAGRGNERIRKFVEAGGHYLGICAGAYYGAEKTVFEKGRQLEVIDEGALKFFPGVAEGSAYGLGKFQYASGKGAEVVQISTKHLLCADNLSVYYHGGCFFRAEEGSSYNFPEDSVLACYSNVKAADTTQFKQAPVVAMVENQIGSGSAILSGFHFEYLSTSFPSDIRRDLRERLSTDDEKRRLFQAEIIARFGIPLASDWHEKIYCLQTRQESLSFKVR